MGLPCRSLGTRGVVVGRGLARLLEARQLRLVHKHDETPSKVRAIQVMIARSSTEQTPTFEVMPTFVQATVLTMVAGTLLHLTPSPEFATAKTERGLMTTGPWLLIRERPALEPGARRPSTRLPTPRAWPSTP